MTLRLCFDSRLRTPFSPRDGYEQWPTYFRATALLAFKERGGDGAASLLNLHLKVNASLKVPSKWGGWTQLLGVPDATKAMMDAPYGIPMSAQARKFAYTVNVEGHGGWADRLYQLLLSPMLVIAQDLPSRLWYEGVLTPGVTHLAVDSNLRKVSEAVRWANAHPAEVRAMVAAANDDYAVLDPTQLNFEWAASGDAALLPERIYDDGSATFLAWPEGTPMPAILVKDHEGTEGPVNFAVRGDTIVLDLVPAEIILRSGDDAAMLVNEGPVSAVNADGTARQGA